MGALDYTEMPGYPKESHTLWDFTATRKLLCDWDDRYAVYLGFVSPADPLQRAQYAYAGTGVAYAVGGAIDPFEAELLDGLASTPPKTQKEAHYVSAVVTITFKTPGAGATIPMENSLVPGELISEVVTPTNEFLTLDYTLFRWSSGDALKEREAPSRQLHGFTWVVTRHKVALPVAEEVRTWANTINTNPVTAPSINFYFPAKTLLYTNPITTRLDGEFGRVKMPFSYRAAGWDKFWNVKTGEYETIEAIDGAGTYINYPDQPFAAAGVLGVFA